MRHSNRWTNSVLNCQTKSSPTSQRFTLIRPPLFCYFRYVHVCLCNTYHRLHPSSILCWGSKPWPLDREPSALTTKPWLLSTTLHFIDISGHYNTTLCFTLQTLQTYKLANFSKQTFFPFYFRFLLFVILSY